MHRIGLVGGMSWRSTLMYYKIINEYIAEKMSWLNSWNILLSSVNFHEVEEFQKNNKWTEVEKIIFTEIKRLENSWASMIGICSNTWNESISRIQKNVSVPILHIADSIGNYAKKHWLKKSGLIGTVYTMKMGYIKDILKEIYHMEIHIPTEKEMMLINDIIYNELCRGIINKDSKNLYISIINRLKIRHDLDSIILGCTEIPFLEIEKNISIHVINSTKIHAQDLAKKSIWI